MTSEVLQSVVFCCPSQSKARGAGSAPQTQLTNGGSNLLFEDSQVPISFNPYGLALPGLNNRLCGTWVPTKSKALQRDANTINQCDMKQNKRKAMQTLGQGSVKQSGLQGKAITQSRARQGNPMRLPRKTQHKPKRCKGVRSSARPKLCKSNAQQVVQSNEGNT